MTAHLRIAPSGEVTIPRDVLAAFGLHADTELEAVAAPGGVTLRAVEVVSSDSEAKSQKLTIDEAWARIDARNPYNGPRLSEADWRDSVDRGFRDKEAEDRRREGR